MKVFLVIKYKLLDNYINLHDNTILWFDSETTDCASWQGKIRFLMMKKIIHLIPWQRDFTMFSSLFYYKGLFFFY